MQYRALTTSRDYTHMRVLDRCLILAAIALITMLISIYTPYTSTVSTIIYTNHRCDTTALLHHISLRNTLVVAEGRPPPPPGFVRCIVVQDSCTLAAC